MNFKQGLHVALDIFCACLLLIASWFLTQHAPLKNHYVDVTEGYSNPVPPDEPAWVMVVFIWVIPIVLVAGVTFFLLQSVYKSIMMILYFLMSISLVIFITSLFRYFLTAPRPYFATICQPINPKGRLFDPNFCTQQFKRRDVQSFPSGHTSTVWGAWVFLLLVLTSMSQAFRRAGGFYKIFFFVAAILITPIWMSTERITGGNHFVWETVFGALIGIVFTIITFFNIPNELLVKQDDV